MLFERLGNRSQVVAHLQAALQLDPRDAAARRALARVMVRP
jgi:hypothetical protein